MAFKFKRGAKVRQIMPKPIEGTVVDYELDKTDGVVVALVEWDEGDHKSRRFFHEEQIEAVEEEATPAAETPPVA